MNEIQRDLNATITKLKAYPKGQVDAKWRNKIIARIEEAECLSSRLFNQDHALNQPFTAPPEGYTVTDGTGQEIGCICPMDAISTDCVIHRLDSVRF